MGLYNSMINKALSLPNGQTVYSNPVEIWTMAGYAVQCNFTGGSGTVFLQASNDNVNYVTIPNTSVSYAGGTPQIYNVEMAFYLYARVGFTSSGTGTVDVIVIGKG